MTTDETRCKKMVYVGDWARGHLCTRAAKRDGFCTQHHPDAENIRREKSAAKFAEEQARRLAPYERLATFRKLLEDIRETGVITRESYLGARIDEALS
jgi:hypothetical protein